MQIKTIGWYVLPVIAGLQLSAARAQDADQESPPRRKILSLTNLDAYLEFRSDITYREVKTDARSGQFRGQTQRNRELSFDQRLGLTLNGIVLDPKFMTFSGEISLALAQDRFEEHGDVPGIVDRDNGYLLQYDLRAEFLPGQRVSGSIYGLQQEDRINRRFQSTLNQRRSGFGATWVYTHDKIPMELSYDYLETDRTGNADRRDDEHFTERALRYHFRWLKSEHERVHVTLEHAETKQDYQGASRPFETTRDLLTLEHERQFGAEFQHDYRMTIHWQEESGDFARDFFEIGPQWTFVHNENLRTIYRYQFNRERFAGLDVETQRGDVQLIHQLYTNLTSTYSAFVLFEDVEDDINTTQYGLSADWQYNRRNRFGHLYGNLALAYDTEEVSGDDGRRVILDESQVFRDPVAVTLRNRNVVPGTVIVTDATNRRVYQLGLDYRLFKQGNVVQLTRIRTGRIVDRETVLVDYQFRTPARGQLDTIRADFSLEQRFSNGMTPYYRLSYRNQEDDVSFGFARRADRTNHHRFGVRYEQPKYTLGIEHEIFDDSIDPYDAFHLDGLWHLSKQRDRTVDASARLSRLLFEGGVDDRNVTLLDVELDRRQRLTEDVSALQRVAYRFEDDSSAGITHAWDLRAGLEYVIGDLSGELTFEYDRLELPDTEEDNIGVFVRFRRELRHARPAQ